MTTIYFELSNEDTWGDPTIPSITHFNSFYEEHLNRLWKGEKEVLFKVVQEEQGISFDPSLGMEEEDVLLQEIEDFIKINYGPLADTYTSWLEANPLVKFYEYNTDLVGWVVTTWDNREVNFQIHDPHHVNSFEPACVDDTAEDLMDNEEKFIKDFLMDQEDVKKLLDMADVFHSFDEVHQRKALDMLGSNFSSTSGTALYTALDASNYF